MAHLDFWFDYSCPYAYLASTQVEALTARADATLAFKPMLLGGVFAAVGTQQNLAAAMSPRKAQHNYLDMHRWAEHFGVQLTLPSGHPLRTVEALRATLLTGCDPKVIHGFFRAYWVDGRAVSAPETLRSVLTAAGHDAESIVARLDTAKDELRARTDEAIALGIYGAPACIVDGKLFWGQDRLHFVEHALRGGRFEPGFGRPEAKVAPKTGRTLELFWDFSSPWAYLATTQAEALAARTGAELVWRPMLLGAIFKAVGQADVPLFTFSAAKQRNMADDLGRWAAQWGVPFQFPSHFPIRSVSLLRVWLALPEARRDAFRARVMRAIWADGEDVSQPDVLRALIGDEPDAVLAASQSEAIKQQLFAATDLAVQRGVFGAPMWAVGDALYWGQDRIELVERALRPSV